MENEIAQSILAKEKRKADANAVLNRPQSAVPTFFVGMFFVVLGVYLQRFTVFEAPTWITISLLACVSCTAINVFELWTTRRRLEAVIVLLQQQNSDI